MKKKGLHIVEEKDGGYYKIELPASWGIHIREELASCDGRTFLGPEYAGSNVFWIVEPEIALEIQSRKNDTLHFVGKVKGTHRGISKALSNGRVTIGFKHAHKRTLMFVIRKELSDMELSVFKSFVLLK